MSGPLIPYIYLPEVPLVPALDLPLVGHINPITIKPFGALVATGVYLGWLAASKHGSRKGYDYDHFGNFVTWVIAGGFIGGHIFDLLLYHRERLDVPLGAMLIEIVSIWRSQASFGGFMGAILGMLAWKIFNRRQSVLAYCETIASGFPLGWVFGRTGCSVAHDHPGDISDRFFAVKATSHLGPWNVARLPAGMGRFDLGLIEMLNTIPLALFFLWAAKKPRPLGFYLGIMCTYYAPVRFGLDFLRAKDVRDADPRHFGLTPAQWLATALLGAGIFFLVKAYRDYKAGKWEPFVEPAPPEPQAESGSQA